MDGHLARLDRSDATLYNYRKYIDRELLPAIGDVRLSRLTARHLDALYTALTNEASRRRRSVRSTRSCGRR